MNFISSLIVGTGKTIGKGTIGGIGSRMLVGAGIGAGYQALTTDQQNTTNYLSSLAKGALGGAILGGASRLVTPGLVRGEFRRPLAFTGKNLKKVLTGSYRAGKLGTRGLYNVTNYALRHPYQTLGVIGGGYALLNQTSQPIYSSDIYTSNPNRNTPSMTNRQLLQSTEGLVQGLNNMRHG